MLGTTAIRRYVAVMTAKGVPASTLLDNSRLSVPMLRDPACLITPFQYRTIIDNLTKLGGVEGLGLAMTAFKDLGDLGIVGHASAASRTVRDTYRVWSEFGPTLVGMMGKLQILDEDSRSVTFVVASPDAADPLFRFSVEELLTMVRKVSRTPDDNCPSVGQMSFSYQAPKYADHYQALFGCPVRFGASQTTIRVWKEWFDNPSQPHDEEFNAICLNHCESLRRRVEQTQTMTSELRRLLERARATPLPSLEDAARHLNLSARTLRRRLHEEDTSYRDQIERYREERAKQYLSYGTLDSKEIAYRLGFNDASAFRNAFKAWTGMTVRDYRMNASATDDLAQTLDLKPDPH